MFIVPLSVMLFALSELTLSDPQKTYAFLHSYVLPDGTFPASIQAEVDFPELYVELLDHLRAFPELVLGRMPSTTDFALCVEADKVPKGIAFFTVTDEVNEDTGRVMIYLDPSISAAMESDPDEDPKALTYCILCELCTSMLDRWIVSNFLPYDTSKALH